MQKNKIVVDQDKHINYSICPECNPKTGQQIIARTGKDGIKIHSILCKAIKTINFSKLLEAHWPNEENQKYKVQLVLDIVNSDNIMIKIIRLFSDLHISILQIGIEENKEHKQITLDIQFQNPGKIALLLYDLKKQKNSIKIIKQKFLS
jgi:GTP pyrophosphokinase